MISDEKLYECISAIYFSATSIYCTLILHIFWISNSTEAMNHNFKKVVLPWWLQCVFQNSLLWQKNDNEYNTRTTSMPHNFTQWQMIVTPVWPYRVQCLFILDCWYSFRDQGYHTSSPTKQPLICSPHDLQHNTDPKPFNICLYYQSVNAI